jgi:hypothetical protein
MLKLWSGDRVFGREARPPEWPYTNSSDRRGSRRKPRQWCRLLVWSLSFPPLSLGLSQRPFARLSARWRISALGLAQKKCAPINA